MTDFKILSSISKEIEMSDPRAPLPEPGFSHVLEVASLPKNRPFDFELTPSEAELAAIASDLSILGLKKTRLKGSLEFNGEGELILTADLGGTATQSCVVSLEPVRTRIETSVRRRYSPNAASLEEEHQLLPEDDENMDPLEATVDLGLVLSEAIALELPEFPRMEGAELKEKVFAEAGVTPLEDEDTKPFASLAALKDKLSGQD